MRCSSTIRDLIADRGGRTGGTGWLPQGGDG